MGKEGILRERIIPISPISKNFQKNQHVDTEKAFSFNFYSPDVMKIDQYPSHFLMEKYGLIVLHSKNLILKFWNRQGRPGLERCASDRPVFANIRL